MPDVRLVVSGRQYGGWKTIRIRRGVDQIAGSFELTVAELWPQQSSPREIPPGSRCTVTIDGETVITGWTDSAQPSYGADSHEVKITGRDATGDLVDCSALFKGGQWLEQDMLQIARDLCAPFGIPVTASTSVGAAFKRWSIETGETVFDNLERMARARGVLLVSDSNGGLVIAAPATVRIATPLELGINIKGCTGTNSHAERFSDYYLIGQPPFDNDTAPDLTAGQSGRASDAGVRRYRPLIVVSDVNQDTVTLQDRATWERNVRAGRSLALTYTVAGWHHQSGLWRPDRLVPVRDAFMRISGDLYITAVTYHLDADGGTRTDLDVTLPKAYSLLAIRENEEMF